MALIIFLRGVNVGGHKTFRPSLLAEQLSEYGVVNIGAAGTLVAFKPVSQTKLRSEILRLLPFEPEVMICTDKELNAAVAELPFGKEAPPSDIVRFVSVFAKKPKAAPAVPLQIPKEGRWLLRIVGTHEKFIFGFYRREMKAIGCLGSLDKLFGAPATTRNWNTIAAILKVLGSKAKAAGGEA